jgi:hypothetical protein
VPTTPPPLGRADAEPLLLGLARNSLKKVRLALEADPGAAELPFWEPRFEWPLCAAVRLGCSEEIVRLLIENGARVDVTNIHGQSPLQLLGTTVEKRIGSAPPSDLWGTLGSADWTEWMRESAVQFELGVATALLAAGADPEAYHGDPGGGRCQGLELAWRSGADLCRGLCRTL